MRRRMPASLAGGFLALVMCTANEPALAGQDTSQAREHAQRGARLAQDGDLQAAEAELRRALSLAPDDFTALSTLGAVLGMQQRLEESNACLEKALAIHPEDFATRRNLASNQFQMGLSRPAGQNLERALRQKPGDETAILLLGMVDEELKDYANAIKLLSSVPDQVRERPQSIAALARAYYHLGKKTDAEAVLKELNGRPFGPEAIFLGAQVASQANDLETAGRMFSSLVATHPDPAKVRFQLAIVQYRAGRFEESQTTLRTLLDSGHDTSDVFNLLGWCLHKQGNLKEAVKALDLAIDRDPSRQSNYLDLAMILTEHRRYSVALVAVKRAVEIAPLDYNSYRWKGFIETKLHYSLDAIKSYSRAVELAPDASEAVLGLAVAQMSEGKLQDAEATFQKGIERFARDPLLRQEYGRMLILWANRDNDTEARAVALLDGALALDSTLAEPHFQLGKLAMRDGKNQVALEHLETAVKLSPRNRSVHYALAGLYRRLGRREEAAEELRKYEDLKEEQEETVPGAPTREARTGTIEGGPDRTSPAPR